MNFGSRSFSSWTAEGVSLHRHRRFECPCLSADQQALLVSSRYTPNLGVRSDLPNLATPLISSLSTKPIDRQNLALIDTGDSLGILIRAEFFDHLVTHFKPQRRTLRRYFTRQDPSLHDNVSYSFTLICHHVSHQRTILGMHHVLDRGRRRDIRNGGLLVLRTQDFPIGMVILAAV